MKPKDFTERLLELITKFGKVARSYPYRNNVGKSICFAYCIYNNVKTEKKTYKINPIYNNNKKFNILGCLARL